ncbi:PREDICTED: rho GTPase-activating protein 4 isoform X2 [Tarenaya hassleriana]|nr:PREDICTED: rho GTPase-activating protein 4 isoform X2 [Tarenaya hassleriana]XP_010543794.1 PREDICTED: rho GTPase-activating protein 4 isoform X2 [Tarenaya hassleriana]XP_010543795.1 PREDICTED: rho GTPase-activating protein 4 isoform X2 [Tarenaya hassleriana]
MNLVVDNTVDMTGGDSTDIGMPQKKCNVAAQDFFVEGIHACIHTYIHMYICLYSQQLKDLILISLSTHLWWRKKKSESKNGREYEEEEERRRSEREGEKGNQLSALTLLVSAFRKSLIGGCVGEDICSMEIGVPTNVRHIAHVTFDRFHGFLGLPIEFEPEVPRRAPSASCTVFGVSTESMQLSFDSRGNSVPTILLMMQRHLCAKGGLQAEGIFRINGENSQEEDIREHLNRGLIPDNIDAHCLAGLIKAWFRELPKGVLDSLSPDQVMGSQTEEECARLVTLLPPTEAALLDWAINLMADVAEIEHLNKMSARNIAMVFAPNMTQMSDPLTALMYAVQVINFLKNLIVRTLKERRESPLRSVPASNTGPSDQNGDQSTSLQLLHLVKAEEEVSNYCNEKQRCSPAEMVEEDSVTEHESPDPLSPTDDIKSLIQSCPCKIVSSVNRGDRKNPLVKTEREVEGK